MREVYCSRTSAGFNIGFNANKAILYQRGKELFKIYEFRLPAHHLHAHLNDIFVNINIL